MGKTITTYLIDGNPKGPRTIIISNRICKAVVIPRSDINTIKDRTSLQHPCMYLLLAEEDEEAYIGETDNFIRRVKAHESKKAFWNKAIVFASSNHVLTKSDVQYLEYLALEKAKKADKYSLDENKKKPKKPNLPEHQQDTMESFFEDVELITSFLSVDIFKIIEIENEHLFYCESRGIDAYGIYNEDGFTVLAGSKLALNEVDSYVKKIGRQHFLISLAVKSEDHFTLSNDFLFNSPSTAASMCVGRSMNGWTAWKDKEGKTLDEVYRLD